MSQQRRHRIVSSTSASLIQDIDDEYKGWTHRLGDDESSPYHPAAKERRFLQSLSVQIVTRLMCSSRQRNIKGTQMLMIHSVQKKALQKLRKMTMMT